MLAGTKILPFLNKSKLNLAKCCIVLNINLRLVPIKETVLSYSSSSTHQYKLMEVGVLNQPKADNYETGQLFLHKLFGYRGVILFPWTAYIFDKQDDQSLGSPSPSPSPSTSTTSNTSAEPTSSSQYDKIATDELDRNGPPERTRAKKLTYYQVLIDNRDIPYIRSQPESVTFLGGSQTNRSVYSIQGLDYVSQNDVIPYTSIDKSPIIHDLFDKFLMYDPEAKTLFSARESLKAWQDNNHPWLELSDVFIRTTNSIRVTVIPFYIGVKEDQRKKFYWWRYSIRIENLGTQSVTLRERHWRIFSQAGTFETVRGKGVVGQEPYLNSDYPAFQYSSHVNLQAPSGHMWGTFKMEKDDGTFFEVRIPSFYLESKEDEKPFTN